MISDLVGQNKDIGQIDLSINVHQQLGKARQVLRVTKPITKTMEHSGESTQLLQRNQLRSILAKENGQSRAISLLSPHDLYSNNQGPHDVTLDLEISPHRNTSPHEVSEIGIKERVKLQNMNSSILV